MMIDEETGHVYHDIDKIRLVVEDGEIVGWYRPEMSDDYLDGYNDGVRDAKNGNEQ